MELRMGKKKRARSANKFNKPEFPYIQHPVGDGPLEHHPADCRLRRPGHRVTPINSFHRCFPRPAKVLVLPHRAGCDPLKQKFLLIQRDKSTGTLLPLSHSFVVHSPAELRAFLKSVGGDVMYSPGHPSIWGEGISCNAGFWPCFSKAYPCSDQVGGELVQTGRGIYDYRSDPEYANRDDYEGGPRF
mgnify:FL=1